ncbi:DUF4097 family beta strand repeat-containing protein [Actinokineospora terrae]|uniref:DUF4097 and DUF4098 domain-containing protein YvlB n=1 Tax=Actinokineospora terrae TaxID=155974 RepID=A0A1H9XI04_9PSEU|nr:DUF4097 family beta strand repeat-containing protein [Actinokineospora terrae]SES45293.1 DUF4097 and DUF4098 domain-containing protein YvlB [Actinokineospora terrae]
MPKFDTPEPIAITLELGTGTVRITAGDRVDTTVDVRPTDPAEESDVQAAERVRVEYANGVLQVVGPKARVFDFSRKTRSVDVTIEVPTGSRLSGDVRMGDLTTTGVLGEFRYKTSMGNVQLERTGPLRVDTSAGHITAEGIAGDAEVHTGSGRVHLGTVDGSLVVKNSNGGTEVGTVTGDVRVRSANGDITVEQAGAGVEAKSSLGAIRVGRIARGSIELGTAMGDLEIGIAEGTAAWLDVSTGFGQVRNLLTDATRPEESDETAEVHAHTSFGAITIRRS